MFKLFEGFLGFLGRQNKNIQILDNHKNNKYAIIRKQMSINEIMKPTTTPTVFVNLFQSVWEVF